MLGSERVPAIIGGVWMSPHYRARGLVALAAAAGTVTIVSTMQHTTPHVPDMAQNWMAARYLLEGQRPYDLIGPGRAFDQDFLFPYPLTAAVLLMPFTWLGMVAMGVVVSAVSSAALAWVLTRERWNDPRLWVFTSLAWIAAANMTQWSVIMTAAALTPVLGFIFAAKPTIGAAMWVAYPSRRALVLAAVFAIATVLVWPWWVAAWLPAARTMTHMRAPITVPGGVLVLLALLRWRRPEARLLVALACVPQTAVLYEAVPLFLIVRAGWEGALLSVLTYVTFGYAPQPPFPVDGPHIYQWACWMMWVLYLPCVGMVLLRPNADAVPTSTVPAAARLRNVETAGSAAVTANRVTQR
jgi:hypothetical protein